MNMPAGSGRPIHQIICEHPAASIDEFNAILCKSDFIIVEEFYNDRDIPLGENSHYSIGRVLINPLFIGKVKPYSTTTHNRKRSHEA